MRRTTIFLGLLAVGLVHAEQPSPNLTWPEALRVTEHVARSQGRDLSPLREHVLRAYFDALIADLEFQAAAENIAVDSYHLATKQRESNKETEAELGVLAAEIQYRKSLERRHLASKKQRLARETLRSLLNLERTPSGIAQVQAVIIPDELPPAEDLLEVTLRVNKEWLAATRNHVPPLALRRLRDKILLEVLDARFDVERISKLSLPRVGAETEHAELALEKAREELANGVRTDLGKALSRTSDARVKKAEIEAEIALAALRLEALIGKPLSTAKLARN